MGKKAKVAEAIPVPHDGFIRFSLNHSSDDEINENSSAGVTEALAVLSLNSSESSHVEQLWRALTTSTQNRDQLQALQTFRNALPKPGSAQVIRSNAAVFVGTYRVLLELSLSHMTNQPLRRAIRANMDALCEILDTEILYGIHRHVVTTIWQLKFWENPLQTLFEALNYPPMNHIIVASEHSILSALDLLHKTSLSMLPVLDQSSFYVADDAIPLTEVTEADVELTAEIATTLKVLLTNLLQQEGFSFTSGMNAVLKELQLFLWKGITCSAFHAEGLSKLGVAYGQTLLVSWIHMPVARISERALERIQHVVADSVLPPLNTLCSVHGISVVLSDDVLVYGSPLSLLEDHLAKYLLCQCSHAIDGQTRLAALRSLQTLLSRCCSIVRRDNAVSDMFLANMDNLTQETLHVVMTAWENPPGRQVAGAIPGLFNSLVDVIETLHPKQGKAASGLQGLVGRVLSQPVNQKGRYIALETLLPIIGAKTLMVSGGGRLVTSLVKGVGDRGHTAGNIACLLGKILSKRREEMNQESGFVIDEGASINRKERRKLEQRLANGDEVQLEITTPQILPEWIELWAPDFARGLLSKSHVRRKQVSSFCIPLLITMVGGSSRRMDASYAMSVLLKFLENEYESHKVKGIVLPVLSYDAETFDDIFLWAKLEIARQASALKLVGSLSTSEELRTSLREKFPLDLVRSSLMHSSERVRLAAFAALEPLLSARDSIGRHAGALHFELDMWQAALPYAVKSTGKEYIATILQTLTCFLDRLMIAETQESISDSEPLPRYSAFVNDFLVGTILLKQAAYPGTVSDKEQFAISLLRCVMTVAMRSDFLMTDGGACQKQAQRAYHRSQACVLATLRGIMENLLSLEVLCMIVSLCHSIWDATRSEAFSCLISLTRAAHRSGIPLPPQFRDELELGRGVYLSASPRQREADTGAMILAFHSCSKASSVARQDFLIWLTAMLKERVDGMRQSLNEILTAGDCHELPIIEKGLTLPMAHGLIKSVRFIIEASTMDTWGAYSRDDIAKLVEICLQAIQVSLSVVADVKDGEYLEGMENFIDHSEGRASAVPLNVNTGAIGANATFSSINFSAESETLRRFATQRVVIGSWLLTREACATLTSLITYEPTYVSSSGVGRAGQILITTMTALKHQGAAYAAQRALQQIATYCMSKVSATELRRFPKRWSERLAIEISSAEKVRDSTLRRSTGYALGFLALMRSELSLKVFPRTLCPNILARLVMLALPPKSSVEEHAASLGLAGVARNATLQFSDCLRSHLSGALSFCSTSDPTSRVHSLNVLRLIILDSPLAVEVAPFVGDCIIASLIGYTDTIWAVRNSATMVFSAAMLRVIDSDKNAVQKDETSSNAISAVEFFRTYPQLKGYLLAALKHGLYDDPDVESSFSSLHSPVYLVLLLLARLQPVRRSGNEASSITDCFIGPVVESLCQKEHKIRVIAGRALANMASKDRSRASHPDLLLRVCAEKVRNPDESWNAKHGSLIAIYEILQTLSSPLSALELSGASQVICDLFSQQYPVHPSCLAKAIEIRSYCLQMTSSQQGLDELIRFCLGILQDHKHNDKLQVAGESTLYHVAGRVASDLLSALLWARGQSHAYYVEQMKTLLTCDVIDTRLAATKAFKKTIYHRIDDLLLADSPLSAKAAIVESVAQLFCESLDKELRRKSINNSPGSHPPTVRRLSRCLLECLHTIQTLDCSGLRTISDLWQLASLMIPDFEVQNIDCDDKSIANALELMGWSLAITGNSDDLDKKARRFWLVAKELNDPLGPWRVRHSVACAIDNSSLLTRELPVSSNSSLQREVLKLLQDSDADVRFVAARSLAGRDKPTSVVALLALERAYAGMSGCNGDERISAFLLSSLAGKYKGFPEKLALVMLELTTIEGAKGASALQNIDTARKIFEDEEPNSYEELLLECHLAASTLVARKPPLQPQAEACANLTRSGLLLLQVLREQYSGSASRCIMNDLTRQNSLFPDIHGLLVACTVIVYLGGIGAGRHLQEQAEILVSSCDIDSTMHPAISDALRVLARAKPGEDSTRDGLSRLCFLLPGGVA